MSKVDVFGCDKKINVKRTETGSGNRIGRVPDPGLLLARF